MRSKLNCILLWYRGDAGGELVGDSVFVCFWSGLGEIENGQQTRSRERQVNGAFVALECAYFFVKT